MKLVSPEQKTNAKQTPALISKAARVEITSGKHCGKLGEVVAVFEESSFPYRVQIENETTLIWTKDIKLVVGEASDKAESTRRNDTRVSVEVRQPVPAATEAAAKPQLRKTPTMTLVSPEQKT